jgi:hypothetical protein
MASDIDDPFGPFMAPLDGDSSPDAAALLARRFALCSLLLTVTVAIASTIACVRCPCARSGMSRGPQVSMAERSRGTGERM